MSQSPSMHNLKTSIALFALTLGVYLLFSPAHFLTTPDEKLNLRTTLSLLEGQRGVIPPLPGSFASKRGIDGREYAQYGLGLPIAAAPWLALGRALNPGDEIDFAGTLDAPPVNHLEELAPLVDPAGIEVLRFWLSVFTMMVSALTVALFFNLALRLGSSMNHAVFASLLLAFCTYQWQHGRTFFTEPLAALCLLAAFWALCRAREEGLLKWWTLAGFFWAYAVFTRPDTLVTGLAALWLLFTDPKGESAKLQFEPKRFVAFATPFVLVGALMMLYNQYRFDSLLSTGYEDQAEGVKFATPFLVGLHGFLFSPGRSLFLYSPPFILALWGAASIWKRDRWLAGGAALLIFGYVVAMSKWQNWAGGFDWGPRHLFQITPFVMLFALGAIGSGAFNTRLKRWGWAALIALGAFMQWLGLIADPVAVINALIDRWSAAPVPMPQFAIMQFNIYLPQFSAPVLHWNQLFAGGPSWLWLELWRDGSAWAWGAVVPLLLAAAGALNLRRAG